MRRGLWVVSATTLVMAGFLVSVPSSPASAVSQADKRKADAQLAQAKAALEDRSAEVQKSAALYFQAEAQLPGAKQALAVAEGRVTAAKVTAASAQKRADQASQDLSQAQDALSVANGKVDDARTTVSAFARGAYEGVDASTANAILVSSSPTDLITRIAYMDRISGAQKQALNAVSAARQVAAETRNTVDKANQDATAASDQAQQALSAAQLAAQNAAAATDKVKALMAQRQTALNAAKVLRAQALRDEQNMQRLSDQIAAQLRAIAAAQRAAWLRAHRGSGSPPPITSGGGFFLKPVNGWKSSDYGWRWDPYFHHWQLHAGTDLAAPSGTPIWAAADGVVLKAGWNAYGYGNFTCIYHGQISGGRGIATCYGHQSAIYVHAGQYVHRGQVIGRVGTTGASTGPHLHFEVRIDGRPVNPLGPPVAWLVL